MAAESFSLVFGEVAVFLSSVDVRALQSISSRPIHHFSLPDRDRTALGKLWAHRFVRLRMNDVWEITAKGTLLLECGGTIH